MYTQFCFSVSEWNLNIGVQLIFEQSYTLVAQTASVTAHIDELEYKGRVTMVDNCAYCMIRCVPAIWN